MSQDHRAGFVALIGRPNTGKSTLTNAMVGQKIAITSSRPQTTRHVIRGIVRLPPGQRAAGGAQIVLVDTPGLHRPRTLLGQRLNDLVRDTLGEVDAIGVCLPANEPTGPGDQFIVAALPPGIPRIAIVTKTDTVPHPALAARLQAVADLTDWADIVPVSARADRQVDVLLEVLAGLMPPGPDLYPDGEMTDEPIEARLAEFVREAALEGVYDELPHSLAVVVEEITDYADPGDGRVGKDIRVTLYVERDSQKGIVIGQGGSRLKQVRQAARRGIRQLYGCPVRLDLHVKVAKDWQRDPKQLRRLGF